MITKIIYIMMFGVFLFSFELDKKYDYDDNPFWESHYDVPKYMGGLVVAGAIIEGSDSRFGKTLFKSIDSFIISSIIVQGIKRATGRVRPRSAKSSSEWFNYESTNLSFPSGHVSSVTSMVVPIILEYSKDKPWVHGLWFFPIQQMVGRVKLQAHWSSDVLVGFALGLASGYFTHKNDSLILSLSSDRQFIGLRYRF